MAPYNEGSFSGGSWGGGRTAPGASGGREGLRGAAKAVAFYGGGAPQKEKFATNLTLLEPMTCPNLYSLYRTFIVFE